MSDPLDQCRAVSGNLVCDRERGHLGPHRGYYEAIDEAVFWGEPMRRRDPATEAIDYFEHAPLEAAVAVLRILTGIVSRRTKDQQPTPEAPKGKP
jgi:hypothetical protein